MRRKLFLLLSTASLFVSAELFVLRARSTQMAEPRRFLLHVGGGHQYVCLWSESRCVTVKVTDNWPVEPGGNREAEWASCRSHETADRPFPRDDGWSEFAGCALIRGADELFDDKGRTVYRPGVAILLPYAALATPFLLPPALVGLRLLREQRRRRQCRCVRCGYDLRASTDRCPECGRAMTRPRNDFQGGRRPLAQ
jgi:hypothetical protein